MNGNRVSQQMHKNFMKLFPLHVEIVLTFLNLSLLVGVLDEIEKDIFTMRQRERKKKLNLFWQISVNPQVGENLLQKAAEPLSIRQCMRINLLS
jgi:hypothetical protein